MTIADCPSGYLKCDDECVPEHSPFHCGSCHNTCAANTQCLWSINGYECQCDPGTELCGDNCFDLSISHEHCGVCGQECLPTEDCFQGHCVCKSMYVMCDGSCVDPNTLTDDDNCGACDNECGSGASCQVMDGMPMCKCSNSLDLVCDDECIDPATHALHCGACDNACGQGQGCHEGVCVCPEGLELCDGSCIDVTEDVLNCGSCGTTCLDESVCINGICIGQQIEGCAETEFECGDFCCHNDTMTCVTVPISLEETVSYCVCNSRTICDLGDCPAATYKCGSGDDYQCCSVVGEECVDDMCQCKTGYSMCGATCCNDDLQMCENDMCMPKRKQLLVEIFCFVAIKTCPSNILYHNKIIDKVVIQYVVLLYRIGNRAQNCKYLPFILLICHSDGFSLHW